MAHIILYLPRAWKFIIVKVNRWPLAFVQGHIISLFRWLLCRNPWANFNCMSYLASWDWRNKSSFILFHAVCWPIKVAYMLIYGENLLKKFSSPELRIWEHWNLVWSIEDSRPTKFVQMLILGWRLTFPHKGQNDFPLHVYGKNSEKSFFFFLRNCWRLMYHIWHRYFINKKT